MIGLAPSRLLLLCFLLTTPCARAQLQKGGLEGGGGLNQRSGPGLNGGRLQSGRLQDGSLEDPSLQPSRLKGAKSPRGAERLNSTAIRLKAAELAEGGLGVEKIQGAVSTIPRSQVGALLYDVAGVLSHMGEEMSEVAIGYYMAVLADPEGERHDDARRRLLEILLDGNLDHQKAVQLYGSGLATMKGLVDIKIGLTEEGHRAALLTLQEVRVAYQSRRKRSDPDGEQELGSFKELEP